MNPVCSFLDRAGWGAAESMPLAGDASSRRYERLSGPAGHAVLMHDPHGDVELFARLARYLDASGCSAPMILATDPDQGLLLSEDFGDRLVARLCDGDPDVELNLYRAAGELLAHLHQCPPPKGLTRASAATLGQATDLAFVYYVADPAAAAETAARSAELVATAIDAYAPVSDVLVLRDFHAENLIWLPDRSGIRQLGLLDFQDALIGHRAYDLASLIRDARRDVSAAAAQAAIESYFGGDPTPDFGAALAVCGVQRNLRILGVFARLAQVAGKPRYIDLIPRVWSHLQTDLAHPAMHDLRAFLSRVLPVPTATHLSYLRSGCPMP
ncbi:MAG: phosphotransferase [Rhodobacteraceae bacterium]|nr:phosphotransferase [Paracoccaceae bacterium]